jgi:hypothetical protein
MTTRIEGVPAEQTRIDLAQFLADLRELHLVAD